MTLVFETNNKGFMCWIPELPGAFVRGATRDEVYPKLAAEMAAYAEWLSIPVPSHNVEREEVVVTSAVVEDGDTNILLETDREPYGAAADFDRECRLMSLSARRVQQIYDRCIRRDAVVPTKVRKTYYGDVHATIEGQYKHVVGCQQYYLENIRIAGEVRGDLVASRERVLDALRAKYRAESNPLYREPDEDWTLRKVARRIIWHDRIHARAMSRMDAELRT
jgi:hypothetical protein